MTAITREDVIKFHRTWVKPNNATLLVVGDTMMAELRPKLERTVRRVAAGRSAEKESVRRSAQGQADTVPDRSPGVAAKRSDGGAHRTTAGEPRRDRF